MDVREAMTPAILTVGPKHTLAAAATMMAERNIGSSIVLDPDGEGPGILTERDVMRAVATGIDLATATVGEHVTNDITVAAPDWTLEQAAAAMLRGGFRHLVVVDDTGVVGMLSMRDIVRAWVSERLGAM